MDRPRTDQQARRRKRWLLAAVIGIALLGIGTVIARLQPAVPTIDRNSVWIDTVKRGALLRQVRGAGTLVPEDTSWITARTAGRVQKIVLRPGAKVSPTDVILELTNPDVLQAAADADSQLTTAEAQLLNFKAQLESELLASESAAVSAKAESEQSRMKAEVNERLFKGGLVSDLELKLSQVTAEQAARHNEIEQKRLTFARKSVAPQLAAKESEIERLRAQARLRHEESSALLVRAGMQGVLDLLPVEVGAQVSAGLNLARVADPTRLKAEMRIAETQAKDVQVGQQASIDTRNGAVEGRVSRIDPSVQNGTVTVDVELTGALPPGARPDLSVDGLIEIEKLPDVLYVSRPAFGEEKSTVGLFKVDAKGTYANRIPVVLGPGSANAIEVVKGLNAGDRVILSDMSQWDSHARIRLN